MYFADVSTRGRTRSLEVMLITVRADDVQGTFVFLFLAPTLTRSTNTSQRTIAMHSESLRPQALPATRAKANSIRSSLSDNTGILLLCEVAAKPFLEQHDANYNADEDCKKAGAKYVSCTSHPLLALHTSRVSDQSLPAFCFACTCRSTKGLGRTQPAEWQDAGDALDHPELKGCHMPKGPGKDITDPKVYLQYNEVRIRSSCLA